MASATKNVLKDAGNLFSDTAHEAMSAAVDTAHLAIHSMKSKKEELKEAIKQDEEDIFEDEGFLDDDYVDEDDLYNYETLEGGSYQLHEDAPKPSVEAPMAEPDWKPEPEKAAPAAQEEAANEEAAVEEEPEKESATIEEDTL